MKIFLNILAIIMILLGGVWVLQGLNILTQGIMAGDNKWAIIGGILIVGGVIVLLIANRKKAQ